MPRKPTIRESTVESRIVKFAKENGIYTRKFASPSQRGVPDRIFIRRGVVLFMEIKRPGEEPSKLQTYEGEQIQKHDGNYVWTDNLEYAIRMFRVYNLLPTAHE